MKKIFLSFLHLAHSIVTIYSTFCLYEINKTLPIELVALQSLLTLILVLILPLRTDKKCYEQILFSVALLYSIAPSKFGFIRYLFLLKIFNLSKTLSQISSHLFSSSVKALRFLKIIYDFLRYTATFYLFLGFMIVMYKYWAYNWSDPQKLPSTHAILYYFMITSSSIGYGDLTPKSPYQMYFMIACIPIFIISFGIYFGNIVGLYSDMISLLQQQGSPASQTLLNQGTWGSQQCSNLTNYIQQSQGKNATQSQLHQQYGGNWISFAGRHHQAHSSIFTQILDKIDSKQNKLFVSSKLKRQFYPKGWTILAVKKCIIQKGDTSEYIYLIEQGQVQSENGVLVKGQIFNKNGFYIKEKSDQTYRTKNFSAIWSLRVKDLQTVGQKSSNLQVKISISKTNINKKFSQVCSQ